MDDTGWIKIPDDDERNILSNLVGVRKIGPWELNLYRAIRSPLGKSRTSKPCFRLSIELPGFNPKDDNRVKSALRMQTKNSLSFDECKDVARKFSEKVKGEFNV